MGVATGTQGQTPQANLDPIESRDDYASTSAGQWQYWQDELNNSRTMLKRWHGQADRVVSRFIDSRGAGVASQGDSGIDVTQKAFRINLFHSNAATIEAMLYGNVPTIDVSRRHSDPKDDIGRVAAEIMERLLNNDAADHADEYDSVLRATLQDRLVPGLGVARVRYDLKTEEKTVAAVLDPFTQKETSAERQETVVESESAPLDYFHWRDVLWSWSRTFTGIRWIAFRTYLTKEKMTARFGAKAAEQAEYKQQKMDTDSGEYGANDDPSDDDAWLKAEVWEIWDKELRQVVWVNDGYTMGLLDKKADPLGLNNFFPTPAFFIANATTSIYKPTPDFHLAQDLYNEVDKLQTRISIITDAVKVVGIYDASAPEIQRMLKEGVDNKLIPVAKWAMIAEKGGLQGQIDWFPLETVVNALVQLRSLRDETIALLYQITGMSDLMRGQLDNQYEGVGQSEMKTELGSIRVQATQEQFATFATGLVTLKAEIIAKHFEPETIYKQANMEASLEDPQIIQAAIQLIKNPSQSRMKIKIKAESMAMMDYKKMQAERSEYLLAIGNYMQAIQPLMEQSPSIKPFMLQLLQWALAGFRGGDEVEGVIDRAIQQIEDDQQQAQENPQPDPEQQKMQMAAQLEQLKQQGQIQAIQAKHKAEMEMRQADMFADTQTREADHQMNMAETQADLDAETTKIEAKAMADVYTEQMTSQTNADQQAQGVENEVNKNIIEHKLDLDKITAEANARIRETIVAAEVKPIPTTGSSEDGD